MIARLSANATSNDFNPDGCLVDCNGAQLRAHLRNQVTVVRVTGDIDAANIDCFYDYVNRFVAAAPGLILDLGEVNFLCASGISVLITLGKDCSTAGTRWAIVGSPFVRRLLHLGAPGNALPMARSEREALKSIAAQRLVSVTAS